MDVVQFGRWISERRRKHGWSSQRALADTARHDPILADCKISEDFIARLEAGRLSHPFRGNARKQVLALAWLLCKTPKDVKIYLNLAELADLSADEAGQVERLRAYLMMRHTPEVLLLSARPSRLVGRAQHLHELITTLCTMETGLCAITGMPGVGKSALAHEALHVLASNDRMHVFPDGIVTLSCTNRHGEQGLIALLQEISAIFSPQAARAAKSSGKKAGNAALLECQGSQPVGAATAAQPAAQGTMSIGLADAINHARMALMDKSVLILLDDLDACFPLRQALEALLGHSQHPTSECGARGLGRVRHVVLTTGCYVPPTALVAHRIQLGPLEAGAALELFASLLRVSLSHSSAQDRAAMERVCASVGYLPLAIEVAANAVTVKGIPLSLLAAQVSNCPFDNLLDGDGVLRATFDRLLANFNPELRKQFSLLATLEGSAFQLECAAAVLGRRANGKAHELHLPLLANTAATLGLFASYSLIELGSIAATDDGCTTTTRYRLHPLLYAYAQLLVERIDPQEVSTARRNVQFYHFCSQRTTLLQQFSRGCLPQQT